MNESVRRIKIAGYVQAVDIWYKKKVKKMVDWWREQVLNGGPF